MGLCERRGFSLAFDDDSIRQAEIAVERWRTWAEAERAAGNEEMAHRLDAYADSIHRLYGTGRRDLAQGDTDEGGVATSGSSSSQGGSPGCLWALMLMGLAASPGVVWPIWEWLA